MYTCFLYRLFSLGKSSKINRLLHQHLSSSSPSARFKMRALGQRGKHVSKLSRDSFQIILQWGEKELIQVYKEVQSKQYCFDKYCFWVSLMDPLFRYSFFITCVFLPQRILLLDDETCFRSPITGAESFPLNRSFCYV